MLDLFAWVLAFSVGMASGLIYVTSTYYPRTAFRFLLWTRAFLSYGALYGVLAISLLALFGRTEGGGWLDLPTVQIESPWLRAILAGVGGFLLESKDWKFSISIGDRTILISPDRLWGKVDGLLLTEIHLTHHRNLMAFMRPSVSTYGQDRALVEQMIKEHVPETSTEPGVAVFRKDLTKLDPNLTAHEVMTLFLSRFGPKNYEAVFGVSDTAIEHEADTVPVLTDGPK